MENLNLNLLSMKLCSPMVVFIVYVIVSSVSLFMTRTVIKKYDNQRMENLYNLYSWDEVKLTILIGVVIYGLCQYDQVNLAWIFLLCPIIYLILKNLCSYIYVSLAHQNAPKGSSESSFMDKFSYPGAGANVYPEPPIVKKEVNTSIFGMRGDPEEGARPPPPPEPELPPTPPAPPAVSEPSVPQGGGFNDGFAGQFGSLL